jgi:TolB-like protein/Flp pilus assembly protein TadD
MKRCPECRRDYYDDTLSFCLNDGKELVYGLSPDEPATAILSGVELPSESPTRAQINTTGQTAVLPTGTGDVVPKPRGLDKRLLAVPFLLAIIVLGGFFGYRYFKPAVTEQINSIAVLPFVNASGDKETEFLSDGISETLINNFTKIPELKVTARSTAFRFRGREAEPKEIGRELGVGSVLTGKLLQRGDNISIQVDLVNTADGLQIWGNRYEGKTSEIVSIQQRIATDVSSQLKLKLTGAQAQQIAKTYTQNPEAYQHYLRGRYYWNKRTADDLKKGLQEFQQAADGDPNYALAYVGLADTYVLLEEYAGTPPSESLPQARSYAQKALQIDDSLGEAHATLGLINNRSWQWAEAGTEFKRAVELNPNYPTLHHWYSINLRDTGRLDEALAEIKRGQELDPLSGIIGGNVGIAYITKNDSNSAAAQFKKMIELDPNWWGGHFYLGMAHLKLTRNDEATSELQKSVELSNRSSWPLGVLGYAYAITGKRSEALAILKELEERYPKRAAIGIQVATVYAGLGDREQTFSWLEKAVQDRSGELVRIKWHPPFDSLHDDPRFKDLVRRMGLPE